MAKTIGEYLTQNGYGIGVDAIRVTPNTRFRNIGTKEEHDMEPLRYSEDGFFYDGQGVGVIARPLTKEYYVTDNKDLVREIAKHFALSRKEDIGLSGFAYGVEFVDPKMQKAWTDHLEYMKPENVEARRYAKEKSEERARWREFYEQQNQERGIFPMGVKDVIRRGGFTPNDYVELKDGMVDKGPEFALDDCTRVVKLPKEEDVAAKHYIIYEGGTYMIGNTDTNEAILTRNRELVSEFMQSGFNNVDDKYDVPYRHHHYGTVFEDPKIQQRWQRHNQEVKKQEALINKETERYIVKHQDELKQSAKSVKYHEYAFPENTSDTHVMYDMARDNVLKKRAETRRATRNMTTVRDEGRNHDLRITLLKHSGKVSARKAKQAEAQAQSQTAPETPKQSPSIWQRLVKRFGGRG